MSLILKPEVRPQINYGQLIQTVSLVLTFLGFAWLASAFQTETRVKLDYLTLAVTDLQRSNESIRSDVVEMKVDVADIKARMPKGK